MHTHGISEVFDKYLSHPTSRFPAKFKQGDQHPAFCFGSDIEHQCPFVVYLVLRFLHICTFCGFYCLKRPPSVVLRCYVPKCRKV